jgi:hypothetical protein
MEKKIDWKITFILGILMIIGFIFRLRGLESNSSFWIDEASSATFARAIVEIGKPQLLSGYMANDYTVHFYLMAFSFKLFGLSEFAARFPSVVFGVLTILAVFLLGKEYGGSKVGIIASTMTAFSVLEIVYSRQARSYQELQFFFILSVYFLFRLIRNSENKHRMSLIDLFLLIISSGLLALTHKFGLLFFLDAVIFIHLFNHTFLKNNLHYLKTIVRKNLFSKFLMCIFLTVGFYVLIFQLPIIKSIKETTVEFWSGKFNLTSSNYIEVIINHLKYYHSLLWRQYPHITLLAFLGFIYGFSKKRKQTIFFGIIIAVQILFIVFRVFPQFVRYLYIIFPILFIMFSSFLDWICDVYPVSKNFRSAILAIIVLFLLINGNKFSLFPKNYYSLNFEMSEIPEPDFKSIYQIIKTKSSDLSKVVIIDNRTDAAQWYLGNGKPDYYLIGPSELEPTYNLKRGIKNDPVSGAEYLVNLSDLKKVISSHKQGYAVFEVRAIEYVKVDPQVISYVRQNLHLEKDISNIKGNPLSIWPIELYSWGFN